MATAGFIAVAAAAAYSANRASKASKEAAKLQANASREAIEESRDQFGRTREDLAPFREAGVAALGQQQALLGLGGAEAQQQALGAFQQSPGQKFLQDRAQKNLLRNASAIGGLGGGNIRSDLVRQGVGFAQSDLQNQLSRLESLSGSGQTATTNLGQFGAQNSRYIGGLTQDIGRANASGVLGSQQAYAQGLGQVAGAFSGLANTPAAAQEQPVLNTPPTTLSA